LILDLCRNAPDRLIALPELFGTLSVALDLGCCRPWDEDRRSESLEDPPRPMDAHGGLTIRSAPGRQAIARFPGEASDNAAPLENLRSVDPGGCTTLACIRDVDCPPGIKFRGPITSREHAHFIERGELFEMSPRSTEDIRRFMAETAIHPMQSRAQEALWKCNIHDLGTLRVEQREEHLVISGSVSRYYYKQLAQELVLGACGHVDLINAIDVR
jgi:hypothetical protein